MFDVTRQVTEQIMEQLSISNQQLVVEDEPHIIHLGQPMFGFTLVVNGLPFEVTVKKGKAQ